MPEFDFQEQGTIRVFRGTTFVSQHNTESDAIDAALIDAKKRGETATYSVVRTVFDIKYVPVEHGTITGSPYFATT